MPAGLESLSDTKIASWIIVAYKTMRAYDLEDPALDPFDSLILAAKASELLSGVRSLGQVSASKFDIHRRLARLRPRDAQSVLACLQTVGAVDVHRDPSDPSKIVSVTSLSSSTKAVLGHTASVFAAHDPTPVACALIAALEITSLLPVPTQSVLQKLGEQGFSEEVSRAALQALLDFELLSETNETEQGHPLLHNPTLFTTNPALSHRALTALPSDQQARVVRILEEVRDRPGAPLANTHPKQLIEFLVKLGLLDLSGIRVRGGSTERLFPTAPFIWGPISPPSDATQFETDLLDDAKLLLNSLRYGQHFSGSGRGRIRDPQVLVRALLERDSIGPATAIGEDYPLPLARGIVHLTESRLRPGRFYMELRKRDVATAVSNVLDGVPVTTSPTGTSTEVACPAGMYRSPEQVRVGHQLPASLQEARDALAFELRTLGRRP